MATLYKSTEMAVAKSANTVKHSTVRKLTSKVTYLFSLRKVRTIDATVCLLRFGCTLSPASLMESP